MSVTADLLTRATALKARLAVESDDTEKRSILADLKAMEIEVDGDFGSGLISYVTWKDVWELLKEIWDLLTSM